MFTPAPVTPLTVVVNVLIALVLLTVVAGTKALLSIHSTTPAALVVNTLLLPVEAISAVAMVPFTILAVVTELSDKSTVAIVPFNISVVVIPPVATSNVYGLPAVPVPDRTKVASVALVTSFPTTLSKSAASLAANSASVAKVPFKFTVLSASPSLSTDNSKVVPFNTNLSIF